MLSGKLHDFLLDGVGDKLRLVMDVKFAHQVKFVSLNCFNAAPEMAAICFTELPSAIIFMISRSRGVNMVPRVEVRTDRARTSSTILPRICGLSICALERPRVLR